MPRLGETVRVDITSQIDGIKRVFILPEIFELGTLQVWVNGMHQGTSGMHFSENVYDRDRFTFNDFIPQIGDEIQTQYTVGYNFR